MAEKTRDEINDLLASHGLTQRVESNDIKEAGEEHEQKENEQEEDTSNKVEF